MSSFHVAVVPVGRVDAVDLEAAMHRAAKVLHQPLELRDSLPVPRGAEDAERGQHRAAVFLDRLRVEVVKLKPGKLVGSADEAAPPFKPDGFIFVTDVDLYTAKTEGVLGALASAKRCAVVSVRRIREAFYRRKSDPNRQRSRLVKELLRMWGRLRGAQECNDPTCALAPSRGVPDLDTKSERFCRNCEQRLFGSSFRI